MSASEQPALKWRLNETAPEIYGNYFDVNWTVNDLRIRFGQITPLREHAADMNPSWGIDLHGSATVSWLQAKILRDTLTQAIDRYEALSGQITEPKLPWLLSRAAQRLGWRPLGGVSSRDMP